MEKLKQELLSLCKSNLNPQVEKDSEFYGRYFLTDADLDDFAGVNELCEDEAGQNFDQEVIEKLCDCQIIYDYEGANPNRQFGDQEIIFN